MRLTLLLLLPLLGAVLGACQSQSSQNVVVECRQPAQGCVNDAVKVRFSRPPQLLTPMQIEVDAVGAAKVAASFQMSDMDMGVNRYVLRPDAAARRWSGQVILPVCVAGRSDWLLTVDVDGREYRFAFVVEKG